LTLYNDFICFKSDLRWSHINSQIDNVCLIFSVLRFLKTKVNMLIKSIFARVLQSNERFCFAISAFSHLHFLHSFPCGHKALKLTGFRELGKKSQHSRASHAQTTRTTQNSQLLLLIINKHLKDSNTHYSDNIST